MSSFQMKQERSARPGILGDSDTTELEYHRSAENNAPTPSLKNPIDEDT